MKTLKFRESLSKLILSGDKSSTWRLFDDKNLSVGDEVSFLVWETGEEFTRVKILEVKESKFSDLSEEDLEGHEKYSSDEEMYAEFSKYYNKKVDGNTIAKIIRFEILK